MFVKKAVKHFTNGTLRHCEARTFCIGTVAHQGKDTLLADLSKTLQVDRISEYRCIVNLEVSCMDYDSCRRIDCQGRCILDTVVCLDKFDRKITEVDDLSVFYFLELGGTHQIVLFEFVCDQTQCQFGGIDRDIDFLEYIRKGSDMVLMSMCDHKSLDLGNIFFKVGHIRDNKVDSEHVILREGKTAVYDHNAVAVLKSGDVHSDLLQSA